MLLSKYANPNIFALVAAPKVHPWMKNSTGGEMLFANSEFIDKICVWFSNRIVEMRDKNNIACKSVHVQSRCGRPTIFGVTDLPKVVTLTDSKRPADANLTVCSGQLSLLSSAGREMSSNSRATARWYICRAAPRVQLFAMAGNGWPHNAPRYRETCGLRNDWPMSF